jgi:hypothetical protein
MVNWPHKNHFRLIEAFRLMSEGSSSTRLKLILTGAAGVEPPLYGQGAEQDPHRGIRTRGGRRPEGVCRCLERSVQAWERRLRGEVDYDGTIYHEIIYSWAPQWRTILSKAGFSADEIDGYLNRVRLCWLAFRTQTPNGSLKGCGPRITQPPSARGGDGAVRVPRHSRTRTRLERRLPDPPAPDTGASGECPEPTTCARARDAPGAGRSRMTRHPDKLQKSPLCWLPCGCQGRSAGCVALPVCLK